jgi:hypothetical protein
MLDGAGQTRGVSKINEWKVLHDTNGWCSMLQLIIQWINEPTSPLLKNGCNTRAILRGPHTQFITGPIYILPQLIKSHTVHEISTTTIDCYDVGKWPEHPLGLCFIIRPSFPSLIGIYNYSWWHCVYLQTFAVQRCYRTLIEDVHGMKKIILRSTGCLEN